MSNAPASQVLDPQLALAARREALSIAAALPRDVDPRTIQRALLEGLGRVRAFEVRELIRERVKAWRAARGLEVQP